MDAFMSHTFPAAESSRTRGLLIFGPPGTNKSSVARQVLRGTDPDNHVLGASSVVLGVRHIWSGSSAELHRPLVGQTERLLVQLAQRSRATPFMLAARFIDEIDTISQKRTGSQSEHARSWLSLLLCILDAPEYNNFFLIGTTNRYAMLDPHCFFPRLLPEDREKLLHRLLSEPTAFKVAYERADFACLTLNGQVHCCVKQSRVCARNFQRLKNVAMLLPTGSISSKYFDLCHSTALILK